MVKQTNSNDINARDVYGSFVLHGTEFAISSNSIKEVVNEQTSYTPVPLSLNYLTGLFNLRGSVIPVVDLRALFKLDEPRKPSDPIDNQQKIIAILEYGKLHVGLLFDRTGEVFDGNEFEKVVFNKNSSKSHDTIIHGAFKMDDGYRIIQIIDPIEVLNLEKIPKADSTLASIERKKSNTRSQCISFKVGNFTCALKIKNIKEILTYNKIDNAIFSGNKCLGAINMRGSTVPIIDSYALLGSDVKVELNEENNAAMTVVVTEVQGVLLGLLVDSVENIIPYYKEDITAFPVIGEESVNFFEGCVYINNEIAAILIDHNKILTDPDIAGIAQRHEKFFKEKECKNVVDICRKLNRKTFIIFSIDKHYALEINEIKEGIDYPDDIIIPPNVPHYIKGIINLRGTPVTVIDTRAMYNLGDANSKNDEKVLIFIHEDVKYGLVIDSIDSIESVSIDNIIDNNLSDGSKNILEMTSDRYDQRYMLVFDIEDIIKRLKHNDPIVGEQRPVLAIPKAM